MQAWGFFDIIPPREKMKTHILFLISLIFATANAHGATTCSHANLTRCLDSACAINVSSNPAARCQYCGTDSAGTPPKSGMRSVAIGAAAKYNISEKELKQAPSDPGQRYAWATKQCIAKVSGCTTDDVTDAYDKLIEQSCTAAGVSAKMSESLSTINQTKTQSECDATIRNCIISDKYCGADFRNCSADSDFDKFFATCGIESSGCDEYLSAIRDDLISTRDNALTNADALLAQIVAMHQNERSSKINSITTGCADNSARDACINTVCSRNMPNKCGDGFETERSVATQLCKFYDTACATLD